MTAYIVLSEEEKMICEAINAAVKTATPRRNVDVIAKEVGLSRNQLSNLMNGRTKPKDEIVDRLRDALQLPKTWPDRKTKGDGHRVSLAGTPMFPIKVIGHVSAGPGIANVDPDEQQIYVPEKLSQLEGLGWMIDGESMMPKLAPGDIAIFREYRTPRKRYPFLLKSRNGEFRFKIMDWRNGEWILRSLNDKFPDEPLDDHEIIGYLIAWYKSKGTRETLDSDPYGLILDEED